MVDAARIFLFRELDGVVLGNGTSGWQEKYGWWGVRASRVRTRVYAHTRNCVFFDHSTTVLCNMLCDNVLWWSESVSIDHRSTTECGDLHLSRQMVW